VQVAGHEGVSAEEYRRRIRAWTMYDWANSAFATTILAAVLPVYYSQVAGETLSSAAKATQFWTISQSVALIIVALMAPILGTISDLRRGKKRFLAIFAGVGIIAVGLLVFVGSGDWMLASILIIFGRIGFAGANVFYDSLLPHVARTEDQDRVSSLGYATGYLGGGLLLAINVVMIFVLGDIPGSRLSFLSVAIWWAVFSIPVFRRVPEPPAATAVDSGPVFRASFGRLRETFKKLREYKELFKFLISFLIYNDGINTIIGVAVIYGAELGFGSEHLILALLLVQFVGIPFTMMFGRIPDAGSGRGRSIALAFVVFNLVALPLVGIFGGYSLDADKVGRPGDDFETTATAAGQDDYEVTDAFVDLTGNWTVLGEDALAGARSDYARTPSVGDTLEFPFNGREVEITYGRGPDHGEFTMFIDGVRLLDDDDELLVIDGYNSKARFEETEKVDAGEAGTHLLVLQSLDSRDADSTGNTMSIGGIEVLEPTRESSLITVLGILLAVQAIGAAFAFTLGRPLFGSLAEKLDTKRTLLLALVLYMVISTWGFFLDTVIEFWFLAWMVAIVQGGSQALSRSLYAGMSPASMSGEFFGFFSIMAKFSSFLGPLVFAGAIALFGNSRPAVLSVALFFIVGGYLLTRVDVEEGRRVAREADRAAAESGDG
jgi:UMF1 family MFS transporter